jgi:hypothetical protein
LLHGYRVPGMPEVVALSSGWSYRLSMSLAAEETAGGSRRAKFRILQEKDWQRV